MKKIFLLIVCGIMLFNLAACTQTPTQNTPSTATSTLEENQTTQTYDTLFDTYPSVFVTENISRITFYSYYGAGIGSEVPDKHMPEIIKWLDSFKISREATDEDVFVEGLNNYQVKIEYANGTAIKVGLDIATIDGIQYVLEEDSYPDCFYEIIEKCSLIKNVDSTTTSTLEENQTTQTYDTLFDTYPSVFVTENISRITFYCYHGAGVGSEVPNEYMPEIIAWLDSFKIGREVTEEIPPGTGFYDVKIEYSDGTVISEDLDIVTIDGISYWLEQENYPDCFWEIIEKCSLE